MAREIVITSVPRGVKLGRTGFQVAMQTAGMRDDVAGVLEKMAGYRHLPAGAGPNPVCYFHRVARTVAGQMHVLGRIVDAGVDFSNRSNKLAHMVVLEATDLSAVAAASPAAVLAAIEGRLAATWMGAPEDRRQPFALAGISPSQPVPCGLWQQVMGDAGWAGVIAERALRNEPTLLVGPDSSPASCRRMLALFTEALAIVPPTKRWLVTFDTTTLQADGILWRGTYAGSPESQATQAGVLIVHLSKPQPLPPHLLAGELVEVARKGGLASPAGGQSVAHCGASAASVAPRLGNQAGEVFKSVASGSAASGHAPPPPAPLNEGEWEDVPLGGSRTRRSSGSGLLVAGLVFSLLAMLLLAGVGGLLVWRNIFAPANAIQRIQDFANNKEDTAAPTLQDVCTALHIDPQSQEASAIKANLAFLNAVLASDKVPKKDVKDAESLQAMLKAVTEVTTVPSMESKPSWPLLLGQVVSSPADSLVAELHPAPFTQGYADFKDLVASCTSIVRIASSKDGQHRERVNDKLWQRLVEEARKKDAERDYDNKARDAFTASVRLDDVKSLGALLAHVVKTAPEKTKKDGPPPAESKSAETKRDDNPVKSTPPPPAEPSADDAFKALRVAIAEFEKSKKTVDVVQGGDAKVLHLPHGLDAEVTFGSREGLVVKPARNGTDRAWKAMVGDDHVATVELKDGWMMVKQGAAWTDELLFMPIGFHRPRGKPSKDDWLVLSQPRQISLKSDKSLYDLFHGEEGSVPLPKDMQIPGRSTEPAAPWTSAAYKSHDGSLTAKVHGDGEEAVFEVTAKIGDRDYTLVELIRFDAKDAVLRRIGAAWGERRARSGWLDDSIKDRPDLEMIRIGFKGGIPAKEMPTPTTYLPQAVRAMLPAEKKPWNINDAQDLLVKWLPKEKSSKDFDHDKAKNLGELLEHLRTIEGSETAGFGKERWDAYKQIKGEPSNPGEFTFKPSEKHPNESDDAYKTRSQKDETEQRSKHGVALRIWQDWQDEGKQKVRADVRNADELLRYIKQKPSLVAAGGGKGDIDAGLAAIHVLLGLDGLIVAKVKREPLDQLLKRIPVAALFQGEQNEHWTLDGVGDISVPVATLSPAVLPPQTSAPAVP
jgi:hypothetical protein